MKEDIYKIVSKDSSQKSHEFLYLNTSNIISHTLSTMYNFRRIDINYSLKRLKLDNGEDIQRDQEQRLYTYFNKSTSHTTNPSQIYNLLG